MAQAMNAIVSCAFAPKTHTKASRHTCNSSHWPMADSPHALIGCAFTPNSRTTTVVEACYASHRPMTYAVDSLSGPAFAPYTRSPGAISFDASPRFAHTDNTSPGGVCETKYSITSGTVSALDPWYGNCSRIAFVWCSH